jgi:poly(3-hydroxybutyrate) depolymerase
MDDPSLIFGQGSTDFPSLTGADQPARRRLGIHEVRVGHTRVPVLTQDVFATAFATLVSFTRSDSKALPGILIVPPLSGHFAFLMRDMVTALVADFRVLLLDWTNVRHVPTRHGPFGFDDNIATVMRMARHGGRGLAVVGVCQGGVPALAATALLAAADDLATPESLTLIATPVDPLARPTRVVRLLRERPLGWFTETANSVVPDKYAGAGRLVYPAKLQLSALLAYLRRHLDQSGELRDKARHDDGADPRRFPFLDLYSSIMDLDAKHFVENIDRVFHTCALSRGSLRYDGEPVDLREIRRTALLTIEGREDDIAAPGQTSAAHALCTALPTDLHQMQVISGAGHFSLFHGAAFRREVLPVLRDFCRGPRTRVARH